MLSKLAFTHSLPGPEYPTKHKIGGDCGSSVAKTTKRTSISCVNSVIHCFGNINYLRKYYSISKYYIYGLISLKAKIISM